MQKNLFLALFLFCAAVSATAQKNRISYSGAVSVGVLSGQSPAELQLQMINGVKLKTWSAGLGVGLDYYHTRTVPLFLQLRKTVNGNAHTPFFYLNGGFNVPWAEPEKEFFVISYNRGYYGEGGIGYEVPVLKTRRLFFSGGWQVKTFSTKVNSMPWLSVWPPPPHTIRDYDYTLKTLVVKAGLRF